MTRVTLYFALVVLVCGLPALWISTWPREHSVLAAGIQGDRSQELMPAEPSAYLGKNLIGTTEAEQQKDAAQDDRPAEEVYKNIQSFKGVPSKRILAIMGGFKMALGVDCTHCHIKDQLEKDDLKTKLIARKMVAMVMDINSRQLAGIGKVSCYTCHRGEPHPLTTPPAK